MSETVIVEGGPPWGFRLLGTASKHSNIVISQVNPGSPADRAGLRSRDIIQAINGIVLSNCNLEDAQALVRSSKDGKLHLVLKLASIFDAHPCQARAVEPEMVTKAKTFEKPRTIGQKGEFGSLVTMGKAFEASLLETASNSGGSGAFRLRNHGDFCKICAQPIADKEYYSVKLDHFHKECFVCAATNCPNNLEKGYFCEKQQLYCPGCHEMYFSKPCMYCQEPIFKDAFRALNHQWHLECFICVECGKPPPDGLFQIENGSIYCDKDHEDLFKVYCFYCQNPIVAGQSEIDAIEKKWHDRCFNCSRCGRNLDGKKFVRRNGFPRCPHCK